LLEPTTTTHMPEATRTHKTTHLKDLIQREEGGGEGRMEEEGGRQEPPPRSFLTGRNAVLREHSNQSFVLHFPFIATRTSD